MEKPNCSTSWWGSEITFTSVQVAFIHQKVAEAEDKINENKTEQESIYGAYCNQKRIYGASQPENFRAGRRSARVYT